MDVTNVMKHKTNYLTLGEINKMLQFCKEKMRVRDYMLILILSRTGRRVSEIVGKKPFTYNVGLRPMDIHPDGLIEWTVLKKNPIRSFDGRFRKISEKDLAKKRLNKKPVRKLFPIDNFSLESLKLYIESQNIQAHERIFPITRRRVAYIVKDISIRCNIVRSNFTVHPHTFRHSLAINFLKNNPNDSSALIQLQQLLDHSDLKITMHYTQFTPYDKKEKLEDLFG